MRPPSLWLSAARPSRLVLAICRGVRFIGLHLCLWSLLWWRADLRAYHTLAAHEYGADDVHVRKLAVDLAQIDLQVQLQRQLIHAMRHGGA